MKLVKPVIPGRYRPRDLDILHEDRDILVVNKEPGLLTVSYRRDASRTAERILNNYLRKGNPRSDLRVYVVHRLDRETSGLLVFAKSSAAQLRLKDHWKQVEKKYLAAVHGRVSPASGLLSSHLAEDDDQYVHSVDDPGEGRLAQTRYTVIKEFRNMSILKIDLLTGRKNQIRVHFAERGHPVVGDPKYGRSETSDGRMALHAKTLAFPHPFRGERMVVDTGIPEFFQRLAGGLSDADWAGGK